MTLMRNMIVMMVELLDKIEQETKVENIGKVLIDINQTYTSRMQNCFVLWHVVCGLSLSRHTLLIVQRLKSGQQEVTFHGVLGTLGCISAHENNYALLWRTSLCEKTRERTRSRMKCPMPR